MNRFDSIVIGQNWTALISVSRLLLEGKSVCWMMGATTQILPLLPYLPNEQAARSFQDICEKFGVETGEMEVGSFLREFKSKAFHVPVWEAQGKEDPDFLELWAPEQRLANSTGCRFERDLSLIVAELGIALRSHPQVTLLGHQPIKKISKGSVVLGSGEEWHCDHLIWAAPWSFLATLEEFPKKLIRIARDRESHSVLQAVLTHEHPIPSEWNGAFMAPMHKEAGEDRQRHVWGYALADGMKSVWSVVVTSDESEDNHEIGKKLRRLKQTLDRMFDVSANQSRNKKVFTDTITSEQVLFEMGFVDANLDGIELPLTDTHLPGVQFYSDACGVASAFEQVDVGMLSSGSDQLLHSSSVQSPMSESRVSLRD